MNYTLKIAKYLERTLKEFKKDAQQNHPDYFNEEFYETLNECILGLSYIGNEPTAQEFGVEFKSMFTGEKYELIPTDMTKFEKYENAVSEHQYWVNRAMELLPILIPELWVDIEP